MSKYIVFVCLLCSVIILVANTEISPNPYEKALQPWKSVQKYVEVRPGAFIFYWLYYADGTDIDADKKPLLIWIQGGPGLAATGVGNFEEIGPLDINWQPRNHTWVKGRNLLLIDHPVGTGFSYVKDNTLHVTNDEEMAIDLKSTLYGFFNNHQEFRNTPAFIVGQSYGGKITPRLAYNLHLDIKSKNLTMNLKGIGIGSGWVHPGESSKAQSSFFYNMGAIDKKAYLNLKRMSLEVSQLLKDKIYQAGNVWKEYEDYLFRTISSEFIINLYNINKDEFMGNSHSLYGKINNYVKPTLSHVVNQSLEWNYHSKTVFRGLNKTFMAPSTKFVELLLNQTNIEIAVYNGNLDGVTPVAGASNWVHKLHWHGADAFYNSDKHSIRGHRNGFYKSTGQLSFWSVFGAGHWVPEENPTAMHHILDYLTEDKTQYNSSDSIEFNFNLLSIGSNYTNYINKTLT